MSTRLHKSALLLLVLCCWPGAHTENDIDNADPELYKGMFFFTAV